MEGIITTFYKDFVDFTEIYHTPYVRREQMAEGMLFESSYIAPEIRGTLHELKNVDIIENIGLTIYHKNAPKHLIDFIVFYTGFLKYVLGKQASKNFNVRTYIYLTRFKKTFPKTKGFLLHPINVNSGVTFHTLGTLDKNVIVFRQEEVFKVLMHELIHAYELDIPNLSYDVEPPIRKIFKKENVVLRINESVTDTLACMYNVIMYCIFINPVKKPTLKVVRKHMSQETSYILMKAAQVFEWEGYKYDKVNNIVLNDEQSLDEKTHVTSYYVLKAANFWNLSTFLALKRPYDGLNYVDHIMVILQTPKFWSRLLRIPNRSQVSQSLRMSKTDIITLVNSHKSKLLKALLSR